jgi:hypothetical protein
MEKRWPKAVERGLRELSEENPDNFQFERSMARVHQQVEDHRRTRFMRKTASTLIPIGVVVVIFAALLLIPATYTVTVGSIVEINIPSADREVVMALSEVAQDNPDIERANMMMSPEGMTLTFASSETNPSSFEKTVLSAVKPYLGDLDFAISAKPVKVERGGNALAALTGGTIRVNTAGMTDSQIEAAIAEALMGNGASAVDVDVTTSPDGTQREVRIEMEAHGEPGDEPCDMNIILDDDDQSGERVIRREIITEDE